MGREPRLPKASYLTITPAWWDRHIDELRPVLLANDVGTLFAFILQERGCTQAALANRISDEMRQNDISQYVRGARAATTTKVCRDIIGGLDLSSEAISWLATGAFGVPLVVAGGEGTDMNRREVLTGAVATALAGGIAVSGALGDEVGAITAAARRPDPTTADHLAGLVAHLRAESHRRPLPELLPLSGRLVELAETWLAAAPDRLRADIGRVTTEAMALHWWALLNCGLEPEARVMQAKVGESAAMWDTPAVVGAMLTRLAGLTVGNGDLHGGLRLLRGIREGHYRLSPTRVLSASWFEVGAHAMADNLPELKTAMEVARSAHAEIDPSAPEGDPWMDADHLRMSGLSLRLFDEGLDAAPAYESALSSFPTERQRDRMFFWGQLAVAKALGGDVEGATRDAEQAVQLVDTAGSELPLSDAGLPLVARRPHLAPLRAVLADHGIAAA